MDGYDEREEAKEPFILKLATRLFCFIGIHKWGTYGYHFKIINNSEFKNSRTQNIMCGICFKKNPVVYFTKSGPSLFKNSIKKGK